MSGLFEGVPQESAMMARGNTKETTAKTPKKKNGKGKKVWKQRGKGGRVSK